MNFKEIRKNVKNYLDEYVMNLTGDISRRHGIESMEMSLEIMDKIDMAVEILSEIITEGLAWRKGFEEEEKAKEEFWSNPENVKFVNALADAIHEMNEED